MNFTIILGNGFDINWGLKTQYNDFYQWVEAKDQHSNDSVYKAIKDSPETWSDLEKVYKKAFYRIS